MSNRYQTVSTVANRYAANRYCGKSLVIRRNKRIETIFPPHKRIRSNYNTYQDNLASRFLDMFTNTQHGSVFIFYKEFL